MSSSRISLNIFVLFVLVICTSFVFISAGYAGETNDLSYPKDDSSGRPTTADEQILQIFNNLETIGQAYNGQGGRGASQAAIDAGCHAAFARVMQMRLLNDLASIQPPAWIPSQAKGLVQGKTQALGQGAILSLCAALQGQEIQGVDISAEFERLGRGDIIPMLMMAGQTSANQSGLPFLTRLEVGLGTANGDILSSLNTVQPIWHDKNDLHHIFAQLSWYRASDDHNNIGFVKAYDTVNAGMAYRYLTKGKKHLYGANVFFDHAPKRDHNRMSVGVDARTSQLAVSANKYIPLSNWKKNDMYYEEKAAGGFDLEFRGQIPDLPSWTASLKGYQWDAQKNGKDLYGVVGAIEYSPVPALAVRVGVRDESQDSSPSVEAALRFNWRFDQPADLQWRERTELTPVSDYVYEKVQRENIIRVKQQRRMESKITVVQTVGSNTALEATGLRGLSSGQVLLMPVTITIANTAGAIARTRLSDGSTLTLAQNSQAIIRPDLITLVYGSMQYTSNGLIQNIIVPGGTIVLHGTDIDVVSSGSSSSSVRVRDGEIDFTGTVSGTTTLQPEEAAESVSGVVVPLATNSSDYTSHTDTISTRIDRIASVLVGEKVAPYPYQAPRVISANMSVGGDIVFGLRFNDEVTVSGGTPHLEFTINGNSRVANYLSGSGTNDLRFKYTNLNVDISALSLLIDDFSKNGASIMGSGKDAVTTIADTTLAVSGTGDVTAPSGYNVAFTTDPITDLNKTAAAFTISGAEVGASYSYTITDGTTTLGPVTGTISTASQSFTGINTSTLADGTLTVSMTLTDSIGNAGSAVTDTVIRDAAAPSGQTVAFTTDPVNNSNKTVAAFTVSGAEVGASYSYTITDGTTTLGPVTGTISTASQSFTGIDTSTLSDGILTVSMTLTDSIGNAGSAVTDTVDKDVVSPTITSITPPADGTYEP